MPKLARISIISVLLLAALACKAAAGAWRSEATATRPAALSTFVLSSPPAVATPTLPFPTATILQPTSTIVSAPPLSSPTAASMAQPTAPTLPETSEPAAETPPVEAFPATPDGDTPPGQSLAATPAAGADPQAAGRQLQVFEELWSTIRDHYLYEDFNGLDWNAVGEDHRSRIEAGMSDEQFYQAMHALVRSLGDEHSTFFSPQEALQRDAEFSGDNSYVGIGVMTALVPERQRLTVLLVFPGSPAEEAGIEAHDSLIAADGQPLVDAEGARQNLLRGPANSSLELTVQSPGQAPRQVRIARRAVSAQMPAPRRLLTSPGGQRIGYIYIPTFNEMNIDEQVGQALSELAAGGPLDGLILDNRYNSGGASDVLLNTLSYFIDGPVGYFIERNDETALQVRGQDIGGSQNIPLVVLVGEGTVSFGEVFAGSLKDLERAYLIGEVTDGNVEVLTVYPFSDGSRAWIAASSFRPWNNANQDWEETGIVPDQVVEAEWDQVTTETDPAIQAALAYFDR